MIKNTRLITDKKTCIKLVALVESGYARVQKQMSNGTPEYFIFSRSGTQIGTVSEKWKYLFGHLLDRVGSGDGLFPGCSQTSVKIDS